MKSEVTALVDFGSTFTKVALVELGTGFLLANGQAHTTVKTDVIEGYEKALNQACDKIFLNKDQSLLLLILAFLSFSSLSLLSIVSISGVIKSPISSSCVIFSWF